ncbi:TPA: hypothetical protein ACHO10_001187 [Klebsiella michiganensis]|uniref:hypothetical protein n=1 Tax=Klebsiella michiganensis TaxID=1134687 RepID=UPI001CCB1620|nr:hypothetical protein [Klebsiella michiganensis]
MTKLTITRERLEEIRDYDTCVTLEESAELARMALAAMDSEPVAEVCEDYAIRYISSGPAPKEGLHPGDKLYRHAQQPPVVGDGRAEFETWMLKRWGRERRDDDFAMGKFIYGEDYADSYTRCVWKAWSASRAAMLAAAPQPQNAPQNSPEIIPGGHAIVPVDLLSELRDWALPEIEKYCEMWEGRRDSEFPALRKVISDADALLAAAPQEVPDGK